MGEADTLAPRQTSELPSPIPLQLSQKNFNTESSRRHMETEKIRIKKTRWQVMVFCRGRGAVRVSCGGALFPPALSKYRKHGRLRSQATNLKETKRSGSNFNLEKRIGRKRRWKNCFAWRCGVCKGRKLLPRGYTKGFIQSSWFETGKLLARGYTKGFIQSSWFETGKLLPRGYTKGFIQSSWFETGKLLPRGYTKVSIQSSWFETGKLLPRGYTKGFIQSSWFETGKLLPPGYTKGSIQSSWFETGKLLPRGYTKGFIQSSWFETGKLLPRGYTKGSIQSSWFETGFGRVHLLFEIPCKLGFEPFGIFFWRKYSFFLMIRPFFLTQGNFFLIRHLRREKRL